MMYNIKLQKGFKFKKENEMEERWHIYTKDIQLPFLLRKDDHFILDDVLETVTFVCHKFVHSFEKEYDVVHSEVNLEQCRDIPTGFIDTLLNNGWKEIV